jgi:hypothetical protein
MISSKVTDEELVFDYLKKFFIEKYPEYTSVTGDHSFLYQDKRDTVIVYVNNNQIRVILDGNKREVSSVYYSGPIYRLDLSESIGEIEAIINSTYLQPILALF